MLAYLLEPTIELALKDTPLVSRTLSGSVSRTGASGCITGWRQFKGDPAIRQGTFLQERTTSIFDESMDTALPMLARAMTQYGIYQCEIHFSASWVILTHYDDPYMPRVFHADDLRKMKLTDVFEPTAFPTAAEVNYDRIPEIISRLRMLRFLDEQIYLRCALINLIANQIRITFSCDGSHYMTIGEFLEKDITFWLGRKVDNI